MSKPIRVAMVVGKMKGGGVESIVMEYLRHVERNQVRMTFLIDSDSTLVPEAEIREYGDLIYIPPYRRQIAYQRTLERIFAENQFDIAHCHISTLSVFPLLAAWKAGIPVRINHAHTTAGKGEWKRNALKYALRPFAPAFATELCACSEFAGRWMYGNNRKFTVMCNSVDFTAPLYAYNEGARQETRRELGLDSAFVIGHVGRFAQQKNHSFLLDIFKEIRETRPEAKLLLIGSGERETEIRRKAESLGLTDAVLFLGQRSDVPRLYQAMDVFIMPSLYEGLGMTTLEAQYAGLPVIMSDVIPQETTIDRRLAQYISLSESASVWAARALELYETRKGRRAEPLEVVSYKSEYRYVGPEDLTDWYLELAGRQAKRDSGKEGI